MQSDSTSPKKGKEKKLHIATFWREKEPACAQLHAKIDSVTRKNNKASDSSLQISFLLFTMLFALVIPSSPFS
jgi:hypothetical protein